MNRETVSPKITKLSWGSVEVEGYKTPFKDVKLFPGGAREWNWRETGTDHSPGILPADVEELLAKGAEVVVLSQGMNGRLHLSWDTARLLEEKGVEAHIAQTDKAVKIYNELRQKRPTGALIHTTC